MLDELINNQAAAVNRGDADAFAATVHPEAEWEDAAFWSEETRTWHGPAGVREWFQKILVEPWRSLSLTVGEVTEASDDRVFFSVLVTAAGKDSGAEIQQRFWQVYWLRDGLVAKRQTFTERDEALAAAGVG